MNKTKEPNQLIIHALLFAIAAAMLCGCRSPATAHIETSCADVMHARPAVQVAARVEFQFGGEDGSR